MERRRAVLLCIVVLKASFVVGCDAPHETSSKPTGLWSVYRTFDGSVERGPELTSWSDDAGSGIRMNIVCYTDWFSGDIQGDQLTLASSSAQWSGTIDGDSMQGTFAGTSGSGTWRAVKSAATCNLYEVWAGNTYLGCGSLEGYHPDTSGYTLLGTATSTQTFAAGAGFLHYVVVTRGMNVALVDAVLCSDAAYYGTESTGNTTNYEKIAGPPDGQAATVGVGTMDGGGYVMIDPAAPTTSITVFIAPAG